MKFETYVKKNFAKIEEIKTKSPAATVKAAERFFSGVNNGSVIGISGNLGAGKTAFISGTVKPFGIRKKDITSPTFGYVREYRGKKAEIFHFDFYRINDYDQLIKLGYRDNYLYNEEAVVLIEWADLIKQAWKDMTHAVRIDHAGGNERNIFIYRRKT